MQAAWNVCFLEAVVRTSKAVSVMDPIDLIEPGERKKHYFNRIQDPVAVVCGGSNLKIITNL